MFLTPCIYTLSLLTQFSKMTSPASFQIDLKCLLQSLETNCLTGLSTDCLHDAIAAKVLSLIFYCLMSLQPKRWLLAYRSMYTGFFMELRTSVLLISYSSLLIAKSVYLVVARDGYLRYKGVFQIGLHLC